MYWLLYLIRIMSNNREVTNEQWKSGSNAGGNEINANFQHLR